jgi:3-methylcrotonyl-CoA carboxylase beta subunit
MSVSAMPRIESAIIPGGGRFNENKVHYDGLLKDLRAALEHTYVAGGQVLVDRHYKRGKILARERIDLLVDPLTSFLELSPLAAWKLYGNEVPGAGIVTGIGIIQGVPCMIIANDATVKGGSFFAETIKKHVRAQKIAEENRLPCIYLVDCGGAYLPEQDRVFPDKDQFGACRRWAFRKFQLCSVGAPPGAHIFPRCPTKLSWLKARRAST